MAVSLRQEGQDRADFVSYNAVLALAEAGHRPETDEHLARAVKAMLAAQRPEGSWEGDPVYQGFNTPFRATQFAVMALSTLYPGTTKAKNWDAAYPAPAHDTRHERPPAASANNLISTGTLLRSRCSSDS